MNLVLTLILLGNFTITAYRSVPSQTDDSPYYTSTGEHVCKHGVAISQDLLANNGGQLHYGDLVYIEDVGFKIVNDVMNKRHKNRMDIWVPKYEDELKFYNKFKNRKVNVWIIKGNGGVFPLLKRNIFKF